jgi:hypothetical protein
MKGSVFDNELLEQMAAMLNNGYICIPIDKETKDAFYVECAIASRNPHEVIRKDIRRRIAYFRERQQEEIRIAKQQQDKQLKVFTETKKKLQKQNNNKDASHAKNLDLPKNND